MSVQIAGLGLALPEFAMLQEHAAIYASAHTTADEKQHRLLKRLYDRSGIEQRYSVLLEAIGDGGEAPQSFFPDPATQPAGPGTAVRMDFYSQFAPKLATAAGQRALAAADVDPKSITHLVTVSCSGFEAPGVDFQVIEQLGLPVTTARTHVGFMGCHGMMNGLRVGRAYAHSDTSAVVLVVAVETCSVHYQYDWTPQNMVANSLFADGAAACVLRAGETDKLTLVDNFAEVVPGTGEAMTWKIGDTGFAMTLSSQVPEWIHEGLRSRIEPWLARHQLAIDDIAAWCIHPGGPRILDASVAALGLPESSVDASRAVLARCGNMSSPTVMFVLDELIERGAKPPIVMLGFGPGLAIEGALLA